MMEILLDPNVAYVLLVTGFILAILALASPGTGFMELAALFILFLAGYAIFRLSFRIWALILVILSIVPFIISIRYIKHWSFLLLSVVFLILGTIFLFPSENGSAAIQPALAVVVSISALTVLWIIGRRGIEAVTQKPTFDLERLIGKTGEASEDFDREGSVYVMGEEWTARINHPIQKGSRVRVISREGLILNVEEVKSSKEFSDSANSSGSIE